MAWNKVSLYKSASQNTNNEQLLIIIIYILNKHQRFKLLIKQIKLIINGDKIFKFRDIYLYENCIVTELTANMTHIVTHIVFCDKLSNYFFGINR